MLEPVIISKRARYDEADALTNDSHQVGYGNTQSREHHTFVLICDIVVVPDVQDDTRRTGAPGHHEAREVRNIQLRRDICRRVDGESGECERKPKSDEWEPQPREI